MDILLNSGMANSKNDARRLISQGGVYFDGTRIGSESEIIDREGVLKVGKRRFLKLEKDIFNVIRFFIGIMLSKYIRNIDVFGKNVALVFLGSSLVNLFNLLYQLLIAHRLEPADFSAFNTLISLFMIVSSPLLTIQIATAKYCSEYLAQKQQDKIKALVSRLLGKMSVAAILTFFVVYAASGQLADKLKIHSVTPIHILTLLLVTAWLSPVFLGVLQGFELFKWLTSVSVISGALKLILALIFIRLGFKIAGALDAFLVSSVIGIIISIIPIKNLLFFGTTKNDLDFKGFFFYLFPVAISSFCFMSLVNGDMVLVKYFFSNREASFYAVPQMIGKIFLFLPGAISIVMFPRTSGLNAKNMDTVSTLKRSLMYAAILCCFAGLVYNIFPVFVLRLLTGKVLDESVILGRLFGLSMTFFAFLQILISYFLSIKDTRFIKPLFLFTILQFAVIGFFHAELIQVQTVLCVNAIILFFLFLRLAHKRQNCLVKTHK